MASKKFIKMCDIYKKFAKDWNCDFSKEAMEEMYLYESKGIGSIDISGFNITNKIPNGYAVGKKWLNVTVSMWLEDFRKKCLKGRFFREVTIEELKLEYPLWWLKKIGLIDGF